MEMPNMMPVEAPKAIPELPERAKEIRTKIEDRIREVAKTSVIMLGEPQGMEKAVKEAVSNVIYDSGFLDMDLAKARDEITRLMVTAFRGVIEKKIASVGQDDTALTRYGDFLEAIEKMAGEHQG